MDRLLAPAMSALSLPDARAEFVTGSGKMAVVTFH